MDTSDRLAEVELEDQDKWIRLSDDDGIGETRNGSLPQIVLSVLAHSIIQRDSGSIYSNEKL